MMKTSIYFCLAASAALFLPFSAIAENGPTYEQTTAFILEKLSFQDDCTGFSCEFTYSFPEQCLFEQTMLTSYTAAQNVNGYGESGGWVEILVTRRGYLKDFDPSLTKMHGSGTVTITVKDELDLVSMETSERYQKNFATDGSENLDHCGSSLIKSENAFVGTCNKKNGDRIVYISPAKKSDSEKLQKAFSHLIKLCGGEKELF